VIHFYLEKTLLSGMRTFRLEVEYAVPTGSILGVVGPSESGKTTLLRCLAGLERPDSGFILAEDQTWFDSGQKWHLATRKRPVGLVFQDYALFPHLTVLGNLLYACNDRARAWKFLEKVHLTDVAQQFPRELSGGQKQRTALARALVRGPSVLLLDEPLSAVDETLRDEIGAELAKVLTETGMTAVVVSHSRQEIARLSTEVLSLRDGHLDPEKHLF